MIVGSMSKGIAVYEAAGVLKNLKYVHQGQMPLSANAILAESGC